MPHTRFLPAARRFSLLFGLSISKSNYAYFLSEIDAQGATPKRYSEVFFTSLSASEFQEALHQAKHVTHVSQVSSPQMGQK
jgi:hypothetical protein